MNTEHSKILICDDDSVFRTRLGRAFRERGLEVAEAENADQALELAGRFAPQRAVVDLRMPGASGVDLVGRLHQLIPELRIVVLTGYGSIATAVRALQSGAVNYLTKPANADEILRAFAPEDEPQPTRGDGPFLEQVEWEHINRVLAECDGNLTHAAKLLGLHRRSLQRKLQKRPTRLI